VYHDYALRFGPRKTFYQERNRYLMLFKAYRWRTLLALLPALVAAEVVTWGFVLLKEPRRFTNKLQAYCWILGHWGEVREERRKTQAQRRVWDREILAQCTCQLSYEQASEGLAGRLAHRLFDPWFQVLQRMALALVRW